MKNKETVDVMETVLFTKIVEEEFNKNPVSEILPIMRYVGAEWGLNISRENQFKIAKKIIINSINKN